MSMRRSLFGLLLLMAGVILAPHILAHRGYVLILVGPYRAEMTFISLLTLLLFSWVVLSVATALLRKIWQLKGWLRRHRQSRACDNFRRALLKGIEGDYQQAEKLLANNADRGEQPLLYYLLAAEAARQQGNWLQVKRYLARVENLVKDEVNQQYELAFEICWARLQLATKQVAQARNTIDTLLLSVPKHPEVRHLAQQLDTKAAVEPITPCVP